MDNYAIHWTDSAVKRAEDFLKNVHGRVLRSNIATRIEPCGNFLLRTATYSEPAWFDASVMRGRRRVVSLDMVVTIPETVCSFADIEAGQYLNKRREFLRSVALTALLDTPSTEEEGKKRGSKKSRVEAEVKKDTRLLWTLEPFHGCLEKDVLCVTEEDQQDDTTHALSFAVHIHAAPYALPGRIVSGKNASRPKNQYYVSMLREDFAMAAFLEHFHSQLRSSAVLVRASINLSTWAAHRGLRSGNHFQGGLSSFQIMCMLSKCIEENIVSSSMSDEIILRAVLAQISRGLFEKSETMDGAETVGLTCTLTPRSNSDENRTASTSSVVDVNVLHNVSYSFFCQCVKRSVEEALRAPVILESINASYYRPFCFSADLALQLSSNEDLFDVDALVKESELPQCSPSTKILKPIVALLLTALEGRVSQCAASLNALDSRTVTVLLQFHSEKSAGTRLTRGPPIEETSQVAAFNQFWGSDRTSTRQMNDGGIFQCVAWPVSTTASTTDVICFIAQTALNRHLVSSPSGPPGWIVSSVFSGLMRHVSQWRGHELLDVQPFTLPSLRQSADVVRQAVEQLANTDDRNALPCKILSFDAVAASERGTDAYPACPHVALTCSGDEVHFGCTASPTLDPVQCVLCIDDKNKIPDTVDAIKNMKGALCAQLSKALRKIIGVQTFCGNSSVDLIHGGFLFRIYVAHYREVSLLRALGKDADAHLLERKLFWAAQHTKFIRSLAVGHATFGLATRLAKRWISSMFLSDFLLSEAVELLVSQAYLGNESKTPSSAAEGFVRFLQLLSDFPWSTKPLIIDKIDDGGVEAAVEARVEHQAMFILTPYAPSQSPFTLSTPRSIILFRLQHVARHAVGALLSNNSLLQRPPNTTARSVFQLDHAASFDFTLTLHEGLNFHLERCIDNEDGGKEMVPPRQLLSARRVWKLDELVGTEQNRYISQLVELEPAAHLVRTLRSHTRDQCMILFDALCPKTIGVTSLLARPTEKQLSQLKELLVSLAPDAFEQPTPPQCDDNGATCSNRLKKKRRLTDASTNGINKKKHSIPVESVSPLGEGTKKKRRGDSPHHEQEENQVK